MNELFGIILFVLTSSYFIFWCFSNMKKTNDFRTPLAGFSTLLFIIVTYSLVFMNNELLVKTTLECYKLGGCTENNFQRSIIKEYEIDLANKIIEEKISNLKDGIK